MIPLDRVRAMLAAATPGPWAWRSDDTDGCHVVEDPRARYEKEERLAETFRESTADIILMAAAPDLAAQVLTLAAALETAERERDAARSAHAELAAAVRAEREATSAVHVAHNARVDARDAVTGHDYRAQTRLYAAERRYTDACISADGARTRLDALLAGAPCGYVPARVVREYLDAEDGYDPSCPGGCGVVECCTREAVDAARTVLDAALAAAEGTR